VTAAPIYGWWGSFGTIIDSREKIHIGVVVGIIGNFEFWVGIRVIKWFIVVLWGGGGGVDFGVTVSIVVWVGGTLSSEEVTSVIRWLPKVSVKLTESSSLSGSKVSHNFDMEVIGSNFVVGVKDESTGEVVRDSDFIRAHDSSSGFSDDFTFVTVSTPVVVVWKNPSVGNGASVKGLVRFLITTHGGVTNTTVDKFVDISWHILVEPKDVAISGSRYGVIWGAVHESTKDRSRED
jgi:hypothetical protein